MLKPLIPLFSLALLAQAPAPPRPPAPGPRRARPAPEPKASEAIAYLGTGRSPTAISRLAEGHGRPPGRGASRKNPASRARP